MKRNFFYIALCFLLSALFLTAACYERGRTRSVFAFADSPQKTVYLTFDDGPTDSTTPFILDVLREKEVKATFFVIGRQAKLRPALMRRIAAEGHALGVHSYSHEYAKIYRSRADLLCDIEDCRKIIYETTGVSPSIYRFPGGSFTVREELVESVRTAGYTYYDWNACCRDAELLHATADELFRYAVEPAGRLQTVILLCHDFARRKNTVQALPRIIDCYREKGYRFDILTP